MSRFSFHLCKVEYRTFPSDPTIDDMRDAMEHEIDGEICLYGSVQPIYISWELIDGEYVVRWQDTPYFVESVVAIDLSNSRVWDRLIGKPVTLEYANTGRSVLVLRANGEILHICAYGDGSWNRDVVHISRMVPQ